MILWLLACGAEPPEPPPPADPCAVAVEAAGAPFPDGIEAIEGRWDCTSAGGQPRLESIGWAVLRVDAAAEAESTLTELAGSVNGDTRWMVLVAPSRTPRGDTTLHSALAAIAHQATPTIVLREGDETTVAAIASDPMTEAALRAAALKSELPAVTHTAVGPGLDLDGDGPCAPTLSDERPVLLVAVEGNPEDETLRATLDARLAALDVTAGVSWFEPGSGAFVQTEWPDRQVCTAWSSSALRQADGSAL